MKGTRNRKHRLWWDRRINDLMPGCKCSRSGNCKACQSAAAIEIEVDLLHLKIKRLGERPPKS